MEHSIWKRLLATNDHEVYTPKVIAVAAFSGTSCVSAKNHVLDEGLDLSSVMFTENYDIGHALSPFLTITYQIVYT